MYLKANIKEELQKNAQHNVDNEYVVNRVKQHTNIYNLGNTSINLCYVAQFSKNIIIIWPTVSSQTHPPPPDRLGLFNVA